MPSAIDVRPSPSHARCYSTRRSFGRGAPSSADVVGDDLEDEHGAAPNSDAGAEIDAGFSRDSNLPDGCPRTADREHGTGDPGAAHAAQPDLGREPRPFLLAVRGMPTWDP